IDDYKPRLSDLWMPAIVVLVVLVMFQVLIAVFLPMRWSAIRGEFQQTLGQRITADLKEAYCALPRTLAGELKEGREKGQAIEREVHEVAEWLRQREQAATIAGLYGN